MNRLNDTFNQRKRAIEQASEVFDEELKKVCEDRPQLCEERYNSLVTEWQGVLLKSYEDYKKRQAAIRARLGLIYTLNFEVLFFFLEAERRETPVLYSLTCEKSPSPEPQQKSHATVESTTPTTETTASTVVKNETEQMEISNESQATTRSDSDDVKLSEN